MYTISAGIWMPLWATGRERASLITVISVRLGECAGAADKTLISTSVGMPLVARIVTAFSFYNHAQRYRDDPMTVISETDGYLEEVRRIGLQPASVLRQLWPGEGTHIMSSVACWGNL